MNQVIAHGNFTRDPEVKEYTTGKGKTKETKEFTVFGFAVNVDKDNVVFYNCTAFGKKGEFIDSYFTKSQEAIIIGTLTTSEYKDKDGLERTSLNLLVTDINFCGKKED